MFAHDVTKCTKNRGGYRILRRRGRQPSGGGRQHTNLPDFPKNCMKLRKFWSVGGAPGVPRLYPPLKKIKGATDNDGLKNITCKQGLRLASLDALFT